ncbi:MAG TPA: hypothetical protein P5205_19485 [Candidatus Paceibacterota bacterium]|nr:hypothetical protein [Verrucomicrobiota bacterium]HSA12548.1 hypothetical protein [Candidatus Paceibacterota bacterium]
MLSPSTARKFFDPLNVRRLPARLTSEQTAALLSCSVDDIAVLVAARLLQPLGKPKRNGVKYFATCVIEQQLSDRQWLDAVTKAISHYWKNKNLRRLAASDREAAAEDEPALQPKDFQAP